MIDFTVHIHLLIGPIKQEQRHNVLHALFYV